MNNQFIKKHIKSIKENNLFVFFYIKLKDVIKNNIKLGEKAIEQIKYIKRCSSGEIVLEGVQRIYS